MNRLLGYYFVSALLVLLSSVSAPVYGGTYDTYFDWPMGEMVGDEFVPGHNVYITQNFRHRNPNKDNKQHAGIDLAMDDVSDEIDETAGATVYAAADGVVLCEMPSEGDHLHWYPGRVIVIEHILFGGEVVYSQYGHLDELFVSPGDEVRRGDPVGTILYQEGNSHLHFEIRTFPYWSYKLEEPVDEPPVDPADEISCPGPGYKPHGEKTLEEYGWLDPIQFYYAHRPSYPRAVVINEFFPDLAPGDHSQRDRIAVYPAPDFDGEAIALLPGSSVVTAVGFEWAVDDENLTHLWYHVKYDGVNLGYVVGIFGRWWGSDMRVGEPLGRWAPPEQRPLVEYHFDWEDVTGSYVWNWGRLRFLAMGTINGNAWGVPGANWPEDSDDYALMFDGFGAFVEVNNSHGLKFHDGVTVEAFIARMSNENEDAIITKWYFNDDQWLLTMYPEGRGKLIFTVHLKDGSYATVDYLIPDLRYRENWVQVAASYDPWDGLRLYWDEELVAQKIASDLEAEGHRLSDRFMIESDNYVHIGDANNQWSRFMGPIDDVNIWGRDVMRSPLHPIRIK